MKKLNQIHKRCITKSLILVTTASRNISWLENILEINQLIRHFLETKKIYKATKKVTLVLEVIDHQKYIGDKKQVASD